MKIEVDVKDRDSIRAAVDALTSGEVTELHIIGLGDNAFQFLKELDELWKRPTSDESSGSQTLEG